MKPSNTSVMTVNTRPLEKINLKFTKTLSIKALSTNAMNVITNSLKKVV